MTKTTDKTKEYKDETKFVAEVVTTKNGKVLLKFFQYYIGGKREITVSNGNKLLGFQRKDGNFNVVEVLPNDIGPAEPYTF